MKLQAMLEEKATERHYRFCTNPDCGKAFDKVKVINVCPHCLKEVKEVQKSECQHWFGYLEQREKGEGIPEGCLECNKAIDCMLKRETYSTEAVKEIKKWWQ